MRPTFQIVGPPNNSGTAKDTNLKFCMQTEGKGCEIKQHAQLLQRDRAAGCVVVLAKSLRLELRDNIFHTL